MTYRVAVLNGEMGVSERKGGRGTGTGRQRAHTQRGRGRYNHFRFKPKPTLTQITRFPESQRLAQLCPHTSYVEVDTSPAGASPSNPVVVSPLPPLTHLYQKKMRHQRRFGVEKNPRASSARPKPQPENPHVDLCRTASTKTTLENDFDAFFNSPLRLP